MDHMGMHQMSVDWVETQGLSNATTLGAAMASSDDWSSQMVGQMVRLLLSAILFGVCNLVFQSVHGQQGRGRRRRPQRPSAWAFLLQTRILRRAPAAALGALARRCGPVMEFGAHVVVLSSVAAVEEFYKLHDVEFGARPCSLPRPTLGNSLRSLLFPPLATYWTHLRLILDMTTSENCETGSKGIEWALEALRHHPEVVARLRDELKCTLNSSVGSPAAKKGDIAKLPYLQAVVKELFRLHPPCAFSFPRESTDDTPCHMLGFEVAPRTHVLINLYALHRDPEVWQNPNAFDPGRFITCPEMDVQGQHFQLLPFGGGRQQCPGAKLAVVHMQLALARHFQHHSQAYPRI